MPRRQARSRAIMARKVCFDHKTQVGAGSRTMRAASTGRCAAASGSAHPGGHRCRRLPFWVLVVALSLLAGCQAAPTPIEARAGTLDLRNGDFGRDGPLSLAGQWELHWGKALVPEDFEASPGPAPDGWMRLPSSWNGMPADERPVSGNTVATFRLRLLTGASLPRMAMWIQEESSAYRRDDAWSDGV